VISHPRGQAAEGQLCRRPSGRGWCVGRLTDGHFSPSNFAAPQDERDVELIERAQACLAEVFNDQVEFWGSDEVGGWRPRGEEPIVRRPKARRY